MDTGRTARDFLAYVQEKVASLSEEAGSLERAAQLVFESFRQGKTLYTFGTGHSHMIAEELYTRAGGFANVRAILPPELMLHERPVKSTMIERLPGYAAILFDLYRLSQGDTLLIVSNSGRNNLPVELALLAKEAGCSVIALTSIKHSSSVAQRGAGKRLYEIADVVLDNKAEPGDAAFAVGGTDVKVGPVSTVCGAALAQALMACVAAKMADAGMEIPVFRSSNLDGADGFNLELFRRYVTERA